MPASRIGGASVSSLVCSTLMLWRSACHFATRRSFSHLSISRGHSHGNSFPADSSARAEFFHLSNWETNAGTSRPRLSTWRRTSADDPFVRLAARANQASIRGTVTSVIVASDSSATTALCDSRRPRPAWLVEAQTVASSAFKIANSSHQRSATRGCLSLCALLI